MDLDGATRTATIARAEHPVAVAGLPPGAWLAPALALPLMEIALDVTIRTPVSVSSPACAVVRGLIGQRLRDLRCLTGASTCSGCPVAAACDYGRIFDGGSPHSFRPRARACGRWRRGALPRRDGTGVRPGIPHPSFASR
jgi:hypothetical protein